MAEYLDYDWRNNIIPKDIQTPDLHCEPSDKPKAAMTLRDVLHTSKHYEIKNMFQPQDDATFLKFLYAKKFNTPAAFDLILAHYNYKKTNRELFKNFALDGDIQKCIENSLPGVLESRDRKGRCVLILNATNWDSSISLLSIYRAILFTLEFLLNDVQNQANGFVVIVDWTEITYKQSTYLKPSVLKLMIEGLQDCYPVKFKGVHFINQPWYVEGALLCIKPFLKEKTRERLYLHGNNLSTLHENVTKNILPAEFGGEQPSYNPKCWIERIVSSQDKIM